MKKIIFQRDSIIDVGRGLTGDLNHIIWHGYVYDIVSKLLSQSYKMYDIMNKWK